MSVFGALRDAGQLEDAVLARLQMWLPTYLGRLEAERGTKLAQIRSYSCHSEYDRLPQQALPTVIVTSPGTAAEPVHEGDGRYSALYTVEVTVVTAGADPLPTRRAAQMYGLAVQGALLQHPRLGEGINVVDLTGVSFTPEPLEKRWRVGSTSTFLIEQRDFLSTDAGPSEPSTDPQDWPVVTEAITEIERTA